MNRNLYLGVDWLVGWAIVLAALQPAVPLVAQNPGNETPVPARSKLTVPSPKVRTLEETSEYAKSRGLMAGPTAPGQQTDQIPNLVGTVVRACTCPTKSTDLPCSPEPAEGVKIRVLTLEGQEITSLATHARGAYSARLSPGNYRLEAEFGGPGKTRDLPVNVAIQKGEQKWLPVCIDLGKPKAQPSTVTGVLLGRVTLGPTSPLVTPATPPDPPLSGVRIVISSLGGVEIESVVTNDKGRYNISLPPGTYRVEMPHLPRIGMLTKYPPATVTVVAGQESCLDIYLDTGIR